MMMKKFRSIFIAILLISISVGCKPKIDGPEPSLGDVDASRYVAIGTNGTAGYSDDALYYDGQINSYASILSVQLNTLTSSSFKQPFLAESSVGINLDGNARLYLNYKTDCKDVSALSPVRWTVDGDLGALNSNIYSSGPFQNLGVPFLSILDVNKPGYGNSASGPGNFNPYYFRMTSNEVNGSILGDALSQSPTLFSIMLGDQDIMAYAASGGTSGPIPPTSGAAGIGFEGSLDEIVSALSGTGAKGAIGNIPDVTNYPFFTTIPYNGLKLNAEDAEMMNNVFNPLGIYFVEGENPFTIDDPAEPFGVRKMVEGELVLLSVPLDSIKCNGMGSVFPIKDKYILTLAEIDEIKQKTSEYNAAILATALDYNLAWANVNGVMFNINSGIVYNGITMNAKFVTGGVFSLDGKNLNPIGQAMVANVFIEAINEKYNAVIPHADVTKYHGVKFP